MSKQSRRVRRRDRVARRHPADYRLGDANAQIAILTEIWRGQAAVLARIAEERKQAVAELPAWNVDPAVVRKRVARHRGELGKYLPHQGARECARRVSALRA